MGKRQSLSSTKKSAIERVSGHGKFKDLELRAWSERLAAHSERIDQLRKKYIKLYAPEFIKIAREFVGFEDVRLDYYPGWARDEDLLEIYDKDLSLDKKRGLSLIHI